ncbi:craniofacial development protein 2-like [Coccinella septempunctata]|uniref:craniofacial development protein 2-like n=1 Tax=Coccinella septempunctata TaxID=41139 RepID=UPI001D06E6EB|nr:craniofacial development protein 2-like [Coccinella septempunctata]
MSNLKRRPQVSSAESTESHTDGKSVCLISDSGGGKNSIYRSKPHKSHNIPKIYLATYNIRTMRDPEHLVKLEEELEHIKWDIVGLCETRLPDEETTVLKSGHLLYQNNGTSQKGQGGVAFLINRKLKHLITEMKSISDRVIYIVLRINERYSVQFIQGYAPTSKADDEEMETFLEDLSKAIDACKTHYTVISGDFNSKIGQKSTTDSDNIGTFGLGTRNHRGEMLVDFLGRERLYCLNTHFKKPPHRKWTWKSPDGKTKNEIDYILADKQKICTDVSVLSRFDTGSDHRLVRATLRFRLKIKRNKLIHRGKFSAAEELEQRKEEYQTELARRLGSVNTYDQMDINELNHKITNDIYSSVKKICSKPKKRSDPKLSPDTLRLMEQRRNTPRSTPDYNELNKRIHKEVRKDIRVYNTKIIEATIENNANMRVLRSKLSPGSRKITKMNDQHGNVVSDNRSIADHIQKFYTTLYTSIRPASATKSVTVCNVGSEDIPEITRQEIKAALKMMKN